jgi:hypothetical protein
MNKKLSFIKPNKIAALRIISESEIVKVKPDYDASLETNNNTEFKLMMYHLGCDISRPYERQDAIQHRNHLGEIVVCSRWVFYERVDEQWINSGHASREAIDKASGSRMVEDTYRMKNLTEDAQERLADRDARSYVEEDQEDQEDEEEE